MKTFQEIYCRAHDCEPEEFNHQVFWRSLYPQAVVVGPIVHLFDRGFFNAERELVERVGLVENRDQLDEELKAFNRRRQLSWLQRRGRIRMSTTRLARLAASYLDPGPRGGTRAVVVGLRTA